MRRRPGRACTARGDAHVRPPQLDDSVVASYDPVVCRRFFDVANLLAPPPAVMAPAIARRVLFGRRPKETARAVPVAEAAPAA